MRVSVGSSEKIPYKGAGIKANGSDRKQSKNCRRESMKRPGWRGYTSVRASLDSSDSALRLTNPNCFVNSRRPVEDARTNWNPRSVSCSASIPPAESWAPLRCAYQFTLSPAVDVTNPGYVSRRPVRFCCRAGEDTSPPQARRPRPRLYPDPKTQIFSRTCQVFTP